MFKTGARGVQTAVLDPLLPSLVFAHHCGAAIARKPRELRPSHSQGRGAAELPVQTLRQPTILTNRWLKPTLQPIGMSEIQDEGKS
jgi:hypothetical protein